MTDTGIFLTGVIVGMICTLFCIGVDAARRAVVRRRNTPPPMLHVPLGTIPAHSAVEVSFIMDVETGEMSDLTYDGPHPINEETP